MHQDKLYIKKNNNLRTQGNKQTYLQDERSEQTINCKRHQIPRNRKTKQNKTKQIHIRQATFEDISPLYQICSLNTNKIPVNRIYEGPNHVSQCCVYMILCRKSSEKFFVFVCLFVCCLFSGQRVANLHDFHSL